MAQSIRRSLASLRGIPAALGHDEAVRRVLREVGPTTVGSSLSREERQQLWTADVRLEPLNVFLAVAAKDLVASVLWVLNSSGDCIASGNFGTPESFVGVS